MEIGDYETNTFVVNNVSSVVYRIYEPTLDHAQSFPSAAIEIESALRNQGQLAIYDAGGKRIWQFSVQENGAAEEQGDQGSDTLVKVAGHALSLAEEGSFQPSSIQKSRVKAPAASSTPASTSATENALRQAQASPTTPQPSTQDTDSKGPDSSVSEAGVSKVSHKIAYEHFVTALLLSMSTSFSQATGAIPLNYRTVLLPSAPPKLGDSKNAPWTNHLLMGTLAAYLTSMGSLIIGFKITQCSGLVSLDDVFASGFVSHGHTIIAAPFGIQAANASNTFGDFGTMSLAQTPTTQALSFRGVTDTNEAAWKQACLRAFQLRGISLSSLEGCHWVNIGVPKSRLRDSKTEARRIRDAAALATILWPGPLCFRQKVYEASSISRLGNSLLNAHEESHDPLATARQWLHSSADREDQLSRRKADRSALSAMDIDASGPPAPPASASTPMAFARPGTGLAGAMYPTPPDGLQPPSAITPSFDAATSSPRNHPSIAAAIDAGETGVDIMSADPTMWDPDHSKRERSGSNNILRDTDSMVMEGEMFEDNDITEADFNFFDEEQAEDLDIDMSNYRHSANQSPLRPEVERPEFEPPAAVDTPPPSRPVQDSGVFMKPELKHARSHLSEAAPKPPETTRLTSKRGTSPLTKEAVFKRICGPGNRHSLEMPPPRRRNSDFETVQLSPLLPLINKKYQKGGTFSFDVEATEENPGAKPKGQIPETNYLKRHGKVGRRLKGPQDQAQSMIKRYAVLEESKSHPSPFRAIALPSDGEGSSVESDEDDSSYTSNEDTSPVKSTFKRPAIEEDVASQGTSFREVEIDDEPEQQLAIEVPRLSKPEPPEMQLSKLFLDPEPVISPGLADDDMVSVAQMVVEQAATGALGLLGEGKEEERLSVDNNRDQNATASARDSLLVLRKVMPSALPSPFQSALKSLLDIADAPQQGQPPRLQPRPNVPGREASTEQIKPSNLYQIPLHRLEVRRAETKLSLLPAAVSFWETLGLAPAHGAKDIQATCVFPGWQGMIDNVKLFMEKMKGLYEVLKLGSFEQLPLIGDVEPGLVPFEIDRITTSPDASVTGPGSAVLESMEHMMPKAFSALKASEVNLVVFMVYSPSNPATIVEACSAYQRYVDIYWKPTLKKENLHRELVLQLLPADLISSPSATVIAPQSSVIKLCLETYDRCTLFGSPTPAPAIMLEQALPRIIDFKPTVTPSASLIHENSCIHVAYAQSVDERWVSAAWTDDRGSQQATAGYCLGRKGRPLSISMNEVAHEIWESTLDLIAHRKVHWRVIITKVGTMDAKEIEFWSELARNESSKANIATILMTVDTSPSLQLLPPEVQVPPSTTSLQATPVSTPQASTVSPEQTTMPATPSQAPNAGEVSNEADPDGALLDVTEQAWGAVLGHRLNNSSTPLELQPALVSGYLIKRTGIKLEEPPMVMEVNLVHTENTQRAYEPLLREMLSTFRGLGTLARARGVTEREADVRPWHVAAAEKAVRALYLLL